MHASGRVTNPPREARASGAEAETAGQHRPIPLCGGFEREHARRDPKDGELCLRRVKPGETLVEARSGTDVQIVRPKWV